MSKKLLVVNNPTSGGARKNQRVVRAFRSFAASNEIPFELKNTTQSVNANELVRTFLHQEFSDLVVIGGDGTINEAINGMSIDVPVTILSAGTGNDFLKMLPIGKRIDDQLKVLLGNVTWRIDIGLCNNRKFLNGVGIGFDGQIVEDMAQKKVPFLRGHAKYYYHVLQILASYKERRISYRQGDTPKEEELILMTIGNGSTFGGGFRLMPGAKLDDGLLEVCTIGPMAGWKRFLHIGKLSSGSHGTLHQVRFDQATSVSVDDHPLLYAHIDGERMGKPPYDISIVPSALSVRI